LSVLAPTAVGAGPVLITGFEAFGGQRSNPSESVAQALAGRMLDGLPVVSVTLPCRFGTAVAVLNEALARHRPALVLCLGQAQGRVDLSLERVAINWDDARIPDNAGAQPVDQAVVPLGPAAYFSSLPIKAMVAGLRSRGWPASVSLSAGSFVCNHVFYGLMHALAHRPGVRGGFMHLPLSADQATLAPGLAGWPLDWMTQGVWEAVQLAWNHTGADATLPGEGHLD
jgi:pyroglutamyl-peptidase